MKLWKKIAAACSLGLACATVSAAPWTDVVTSFENNGRVSTFDPVRYTHDITGDGFNVGDTVTDFRLKLWVTDDDPDRYEVCFLGCWWIEAIWNYEAGSLVIGGTFIGIDEVDTGTYEFWFDRTGDKLDLVLDLETDGKIDVRLDAVGDFWITQSELVANGVARVPVPGALSLLGAGLLGLGLFGRRKAA